MYCHASISRFFREVYERNKRNRQSLFTFYVEFEISMQPFDGKIFKVRTLDRTLLNTIAKHLSIIYYF